MKWLSLKTKQSEYQGPNLLPLKKLTKVTTIAYIGVK